MLKNIWLLLLAFFFSTSFFSSAPADIVSLTWTGTTVSDAQDNLGIFGLVGQIIPAGTTYSSTYVYDTEVSFIENQTNSTQEVSGGSFFNPFRPSPLVGQTSFTLNGTTVALNGLFYASYFRQSGQGVSNITNDVIAEIGGNPLFDGQILQRSIRNDNAYGLPLGTTGFFQFGAGDSTDGFFSYRTRDANGNIVAATGINLRPASLTISVVPEPSTLVVLISFVGLSAFKRRRIS